MKREVCLTVTQWRASRLEALALIEREIELHLAGRNTGSVNIGITQPPWFLYANGANLSAAIIEEALRGVEEPTSARAHPKQIAFWSAQALRFSATMVDHVDVSAEFQKQPTQLFVYGIPLAGDSKMPENRLDFLVGDLTVVSIDHLAVPLFTHV